VFSCMCLCWKGYIRLRCIFQVFLNHFYRRMQALKSFRGGKNLKKALQSRTHRPSLRPPGEVQATLGGGDPLSEWVSRGESPWGRHAATLPKLTC